MTFIFTINQRGRSTIPDPVSAAAGAVVAVNRQGFAGRHINDAAAAFTVVIVAARYALGAENILNTKTYRGRAFIIAGSDNERAAKYSYCHQ